MTPEQQKALRDPFPPSEILTLPKPFRRDSPKADCKVCGKFHGLPAAHLDYVGHAEVTNRLLQVDPEWSWEPAAWENGLPLLERTSQGAPVGMWIRLTIAGVTRLGFGSVDGGAYDAEKQLIGDAIRNAAMRFGVALDLWSKSDMHASETGDDLEEPTPPVIRKTTPLRERMDTAPVSWLADLMAACRQHEVKPSKIAEFLGHTTAMTWDELAPIAQAYCEGMKITADDLVVRAKKGNLPT